MLQELASSASVMRLTKMRWRGPLVPLIAAVVRNATQRLMKPSSNVSMQLNAQNILDIFHSAAVHAFHPGDGLFLQTVLKMMEIRLQGFSAQVRCLAVRSPTCPKHMYSRLLSDSASILPAWHQHPSQASPRSEVHFRVLACFAGSDQSSLGPCSAGLPCCSTLDGNNHPSLRCQ